MNRATRHAVASRLAVVAVALVAMSARPAHGQSADQIREARVWVETGTDHFRAERWNDAVLAFRKALLVVPDAALIWNMARAYEELGDIRNAVHYFRELLKRYPEDRSVAEANSRIAKLEPRLPGSLEADCGGVHRATLRLDGSGKSRPCTERFRSLAPGKHVVEAEAPGYDKWRAEVVVKPGGRSQVRVVLMKTALPPAVTKPAPPTQTNASVNATAPPGAGAAAQGAAEAEGSNVALWIGGGVAVAAAAAAIIFVLSTDRVDEPETDLGTRSVLE